MRIYAQWAGNPDGIKEDASQCVEPVYNREVHRGMISYQCSKPRGKGDGGLYCGIHAKQHPSIAQEGN